MKTFVLFREEDVTGISGTGVVAEGVEFSNGKVVIQWVVGEHQSTVVWDDIESVEAIHGHGGATKIVYDELETSTVIYRDSKTGRIVTAEYAAHHPATTTREIV